VLLLHNFITPTRFHLFAALAERLDLEVWFLGDIKKIREWPDDVPEGSFRYRVLPHLGIPVGSRYNVILWNYRLRRDLNAFAPDLIIGCGWDTPAIFQASAWARHRSIPFILWSGSTPAETTALRTLTAPLVRALVSRCDGWLAYGSRAKSYLESLGADPARTRCAYNTIETTQFAAASTLSDAQRQALRTRLGIRTAHMLLYCGNLLDLKGVGDLLEAFRQFRQTRQDVTLLLVGAGKHEPNYRAYCAAHDLNDRVIFTGFMLRDDLPGLYGAADLLVLPSRSEVWGLVINEALACGLPVLASAAAGATPDLIEHGVNGYAVPPRDPGALSAALREYFHDSTDRAAMAEAARASIAPFTVDAAADTFAGAVSQAWETR
jgi:glycosyltransferase involved in cell wall biosynthesis